MRVTCSRETTVFSPGSRVYVENGPGIQRTLIVDSFRFQGSIVVLAFREIKRVQEAKELVGGFIFAEKASLPPLPAGEFYWHELQGLQVKTEQGIWLGRVEEVFWTGSHDVFIIRKGSQEILIPATDEVITAVDLPGKVMVIHPMEGLLPDDDL